MKRGKFIVIDGSDGSGKKTQTDLLIKYLKQQKYPVAYYDFPQYDKTFFGKMVGRYLNGEFGQADEVSPYLASLLYAGDRWQAGESIEKDLAAGKIVISNRYSQSNMGFQTAKIDGEKEKQKFLDWLSELEHGVYHIPRADLVIYLYVPHETAQKLVDKKIARGYTELKRDIHEANTEFLQRVEAQYLSLSKKYKEWRVIDCLERGALCSIEDISSRIIKVLKDVL